MGIIIKQTGSNYTNDVEYDINNDRITSIGFSGSLKRFKKLVYLNYGVNWKTQQQVLNIVHDEYMNFINLCYRSQPKNPPIDKLSNWCTIKIRKFIIWLWNL